MYILLGLSIVMALVTTAAQVSIEEAKERGGLVRSVIGRRHQDEEDA